MLSIARRAPAVQQASRSRRPGSWAYNVALLAFVYDRTHSLGWVGAAGFVRFLPALLLSPYSGVVVERTDRFRLMFCHQRSGHGLAVRPGGGGAGHGPVVLALVLLGARRGRNVFEAPAVGATLPTLVSENDLVAANALQSTIDNLTVILGPAIGAVLLLAGSPALVFFVNAGTLRRSRPSWSRRSSTGPWPST